ncbi:hypothetical protein EJ05DRAFT_502228 [Pseudovirgaria hyperparasitica]|uniref:Uncharacterized protein n=1 Tax=Pseudovirgaria hyperparasitica TaxID=470096 RepID=A0A6A6W3X8_9PEZI|nr:uncharacterized protein EJ05DRAFT_502228 [Pseudovirgaria hyperparasitica]KAF2756734.1 hypothetical protein EJ05DRAFT_502228 [Pseudovirgaria hyperparasitica]
MGQPLQTIALSRNDLEQTSTYDTSATSEPHLNPWRSMDIKRWLDDTWLVEEDNNSIEQAGASETKKRKQSPRHPSDSSIIQPAFCTFATPQETTNARDRVLQKAEASTRSSSCSSRLTRSSKTSSDRYDRKPRRKTRTDRYEYKESETKDCRDQNRKKEKHHRKAERKRKGRERREKRGVGIVQSFHAKNVKKERLTLKLSDSVGLFGRGKASSPAKGRGLPDLVFSEMRFLQKRKKPSEEQQKREAQTKRRKTKDQTRSNEQEISAYFKMRDQSSKIDHIGQVLHEPCHLVPERARCRAAETSGFTQPDVEPSQKASSARETRGMQPPSSSYLLWSESIRATSVGIPSGEIAKDETSMKLVSGVSIRPRVVGDHCKPIHRAFEQMRPVRTSEEGQPRSPIRSRSEPVVGDISSLPSRPVVLTPIMIDSGLFTAKASSTPTRNIRTVCSPLHALKQPNIELEPHKIDPQQEEYESGIPRELHRSADATLTTSHGDMCDIEPRSSSSLAKILMTCERATTGARMLPDTDQSATCSPSFGIMSSEAGPLEARNSFFASADQWNWEHRSVQAPWIPEIEGDGEDLPEEYVEGSVQGPAFETLGSTFVQGGIDLFDIEKGNSDEFDEEYCDRSETKRDENIVYEGLRRPNRLY